MTIEKMMRATTVIWDSEAHQFCCTCLWKYAKHYFHFYWETRTRLQGEQTGKQRYYNEICRRTLHMNLFLKILKHTHMHTTVWIYNGATCLSPIRENITAISCSRKTWTVLIRSLDSPWGCDLTIGDNRLSSSAVQSLKPSAFQEKFTSKWEVHLPSRQSKPFLKRVQEAAAVNTTKAVQVECSTQFLCEEHKLFTKSVLLQILVWPSKLISAHIQCDVAETPDAMR